MIQKFALAGSAALLAAAAAAPGAGQTLAGYVSPIGAQPGQQYVAKGTEAAATELGWTSRVLDANLSADRQVSHLDTLLTMGSKAIGTWSLDPNAVAGVFARAGQQGVPVVGLNSPGEGVTSTFYWEINLCRDNGPFARQAAFIARHKPGAKVIVMGGPPVEAIIKNMDCAARAAADAGLTVIDRIDNPKDTAANAATLAAGELIRFPDVVAFIAYNDSTALGIASAAIAAGKAIHGASGTGGLMAFGRNGDLDAIEAVKEGPPDRHMGSRSLCPTDFALIKAMDAAMTAPGTMPKDLIVRSMFISCENVGDWKDGLERGVTYATIPLTE
ncbi:substrate-binding domain-containing protein [Gemmobacter sp.]|uniref:substrate-binding domain-containing protein n=1 Tax=Gemmobacter sp. TaxID=1898957 RepID=UPI002AFE7C71|nr:substrate-binding domain-containing protein [Gemmobacter sp.]